VQVVTDKIRAKMSRDAEYISVPSKHRMGISLPLATVIGRPVVVITMAHLHCFKYVAM
jgi:hypothetical protein